MSRPRRQRLMSQLVSSQRNKLEVIVIKAVDYVGKKFGELTVIEELPPHRTPNGSNQRMVRVQCSCGNVYVSRLAEVKKATKCRKCVAREGRADITGKRFGKLVVLSMTDDYISPSGHRLSQCVCKCDCGNTKTVLMGSLVSGKTTSCGCNYNTCGLLKDIPELVKKYDFDKNGELGIRIDNLTARSNKKVWWKCEQCGNSWLATVASQNDEIKHGCPYCSGRMVIKGQTDLLTLFPDIAKEWDYDKNGDLLPSDISGKSSVKVWWKCSEGHEWKATVGNRTHNNSGCPKCNIESVNSFCEQAVFYYVKKFFPDAVNSDNHIGIELDIYIKSLSTAIEYDGEKWHSSLKRQKNDQNKNNMCLQNNIRLIRIREPKLPPIDGCISVLRSDSTTSKSLDNAIVELLKLLNTEKVDVNTKRDEPAILEQFATKKHENSLAVCCPDVAAEWHPTKNGTLTPDKVSRASSRSVWWLGKCGHEWQMQIAERTITFVRQNGKIKKPYGCPYCSGKRVLKGFNDLASLYPEISVEWNYEKNGPLTPDTVTTHSRRKVWWRCSLGHEWETTVDSRTRGTGCPICSGKKALKGYNDLATKFPEIAKEWHPTKNSPLTPDNVLPHSSKKVWWLCKNGHEWQAVIGKRVNGSKCPKCRRK